jgi:pre-mRNA-splicing factor SPF27
LDNYSSNPIRGIDTSKYAPPNAVEGASVEDLIAAERQGRIGEGHMELRYVDICYTSYFELTGRNENISVLSSYGPNAYLVRNYQLNSQLTELNSALAVLKEQVTEVNRKRRVFQEDTGVHLTKLEGRWQDLVGGTVQLEMACRAMDGEVKGLRRKEEILRQEVADLEAKQ